MLRRVTGPRLIQRHTLRSELPPTELRTQLAEVVEETGREFALIAKLSGAGIVVRVLHAPVTPRPFFGALFGTRFAISETNRGREVTPFQPIVRGTIEARDDGPGSAINIELRPHPQVFTFEKAGKLAAALLVAVALPALITGNAVGGIALVFAVMFWLFPGARARSAFARDCEHALTALEAAVPVRRAPDALPRGA